MLFITEELNEGYIHACEIGMLLRVLALFPAEDLKGLGAILLRQPTRKQDVLEPAWGRLTYFADVGVANQKPVYEGPLVTLEAQKVGQALEWPKSLGPDGQRELKRLREDGHNVVNERRRYRFMLTLLGARHTQLMRTLPHEVGHWVDYLQKVVRPTDNGEGDWDALRDRYFQRSSAERESFAHRYADEFRRHNAKVLDLATVNSELGNT